MFLQECAGGSKNGSSKLAWRARPQDYKQECKGHAFTGLKRKLAWRAANQAAHVQECTPEQDKGVQWRSL
jgi:hypothetical protein